MKKINQNEKGFSLIELLVVIGVFSGLMSIITGIFIANFEMQRRTMAVQKTIGEISYAMEYMGRTIRMAKSDSAGSCLNESDSKNYTYGVPEDDNGNEQQGIQFIDYKDSCIKFFLDEEEKVLKKGVREDGNWEEYNLTSGLLDIKGFHSTSNLLPDGNGDLFLDQPSVTLSLRVEETNSKWWKTRIQTTVTKRRLDIEKSNN
ncbi:MAG: PilW family protein [Patescibacteria group bacterium]